MIQKLGKYTLRFDRPPIIASTAAVVGKKESEGPLGQHFDASFDDPQLGQDSFEKAESLLQQKALGAALDKATLSPAQIETIFAGDLLNQCIGSAFGLREQNIPFVGVYGACSTFALALGLASVFVASGAAEYTAALTSSHFCAAERQFRLPLEYGGQRTPNAQWTVTGAGAAILSRGGAGVGVCEATFGKMVDLGIKDVSNMGAAMAPAAATTLIDYLNDTGTKPDDFDLILTGDLGFVGSELLVKLLKKDGFDIAPNHSDCGMLIFDRLEQDVHAGGSGCGCAATVVSGYIIKRMLAGELKNVLFMATGALMSPTSSLQGESVPGIAHLVRLCV